MLTRATIARFIGRAAPQAQRERATGLSLKEDAAAREAERQLICDTLRTTGGNKSKAARAIRTDYKTLHLKMKSLGIRARDFTS